MDFFDISSNYFPKESKTHSVFEEKKNIQF